LATQLRIDLQSPLKQQTEFVALSVNHSRYCAGVRPTIIGLG
jgi:hypothetical protein